MHYNDAGLPPGSAPTGWVSPASLRMGGMGRLLLVLPGQPAQRAGSSGRHRLWEQMILRYGLCVVSPSDRVDMRA